jgi:hypothetical protein
VIKGRIKFPLPHVKPGTAAYETTTGVDWWSEPKRHSRVLIRRLIGTQPSVLIQGISRVEWHRPIFVVLIAGRMYIRDGHHRVARAIKRKRKTIFAEILTLEEGM